MTVAPRAEAKRWTDLRKRALSAAVLLPAALACIWFGAESFTAMVALAVAVLTWEWVHLCGRRTRVFPGMAVPLVVFAAGALAVAERALLGLGVLLAGFAATWAGVAARGRRSGIVQPARRLAAGVLYIGLAGLALIELRHDNEAGRGNVLFLFVVVWASDIGAYLAGRAFGGPKLAPAISPNKTWSGALGGLASALVVGGGTALAFTPGASPVAIALVTLVVSIASQAGDLLESAIKRHFKVKDTSSLIPGHGGLLDRLDGVLAAAPVAALLSYLLGQGRPLWGWGL
ncbi:phosphatidate cytidylyltransferase [Falsiroseomonas selenitidurans]|uniref:phosphatidate cytidylyltransferase n=1 Tax=Falsiroseomonas selenitidurans TaxID=2716335 RepID=UPI000BD30503|nr:phosphatidate cytidylyltransferase [Falsiroseomonas selenitidurans]OYW08221.1 MAG: phosphatidate cytidylyltransferase [Rhodospirillales bacterium 12-71-4]